MVLTMEEKRFIAYKESVFDSHTGLEWLRNASLTEFPMTWKESLEFAIELNQSSYAGYHDWRLPNRKEILSLLSHNEINPSLPAGHPFIKVFQDLHTAAVRDLCVFELIVNRLR